MSIKQIIVALSLLLSFSFAQGQTCTGAPNFNVNLIGQAAGSWTSPDHSRGGKCCGNNNCTSFDVKLDNNAAMINLEILSGAVPSGSLFYQIDCGPPIAVGNPICVVGSNTFTITFCKSGNNSNVYKITSIAKPTLPPNPTFARENCVNTLATLGFVPGSTTWNSVATGTVVAGAYNYLLSSTTSNAPTYTCLPGLPATIQYSVCGTPQNSICPGGASTYCNIFNINNYGLLSITVTPTSAGFCAGGSVAISASTAGGVPAYTYLWRDQGNTVVATGSAYTASVAGTYQLEVRDVVYDAATCPALFKSVPVVVTQPPTVNAGSNQTVCTSSPTASINGSITNATGGTWTGGLGTYSPNNTSQSISYTPHASEITAGSVTLTLTSTGAGGGCSNTSASVTITYPPLLANTVPSYTLACNASTTPIVPVISGGTQPYSYSWNNGATTSSIVAGSGVYCLTVTDSRGCTKASCSTITVPSALVISAGASGVAPPLSMTGSATVTPTGGTVPYTYLWSVSTTSQTTQIATALFSGSHSVVVTDANGCSKNASVVVQEPNCSDLVVTVTGTNVNCFGNTTGSATVTATGTAGAAPPYSYSWTSPAQTTQVISGLSAGIYQVLATTTVGCSSVQQITITEPALLSSSMSHTDVTLVGGNDGTATATITGGTTPYTYAWTPSGGTNSVATGLVMGNYTVSVIDAKGCALTNTVQVNQPSCTALVLNMSATNVSCFSGSNGTATASLLFGTAPYSYAWSVGGTTSTISAQLAGPLTVTVTDAVNCVLQNTITITQPTALTLTLVATDVLCYGGQTGTLNLTVAGGTFPYTYLWSNSITVEDQANLVKGLYAVTVTDSKGCTAVASATIGEPAVIAATSTHQNVTCKSGSDGAINATVSGGLGAYTYLWTNAATTKDLTGLVSGQYILSVTDGNGCVSSSALNIFINQPDSVSLSSFSVTCPVPGSGVARVDVFPIGGDGGPYTVSFNNGVSYLASGVYFSFLPVGATYSVYVKDGNNCISSLHLIIVNPAPSIASISFPNCNPIGIGTATVTITPAGGAGTPYLVSTNNGVSYSVKGDYIDTLAIGNTYTVVIKDTLGCLSLPSTIVIPDSISLNTVTSSFNGGYNISCNGLSNGTINLTASGGKTPYTFLWNNGATTYATKDLTNVPAANYTLTITDANGCTKLLVVPMTQPLALAATSTVSTNYNGSSVSCFGSTNGAIDLTVSGGTTAYTYAWSNSQTTEDITGLSATTYSVLITDANGCTKTNTVTLTQPALLTNTVVAATYNGQNISCNGLSDGSIGLTVAGGTTAYTYAWSNSQTTQNISGLNANTYSVLVTDVNGCTSTNTVTLTQPAVLSNTIAISSNYNGQDISCNGLSNGSIGLTVAGGTTAYTYAWSNSQTTQNISGLNANTYSVLVTDVNGCTTTNTVTLTEPAVLTNTISISSNYNGQNISCNGLSDGSIGLTVAGGTTAYTYAWSNSQTTQNISGLNANTYSVLVTDVNGCTTTNTVTISQPLALTTTLAISSNFNGQNISCNGLSDGGIDLTVAGGTTAYTYAWSNSQTTQNISGLNANTYSVLVTDVNGCTTTNTIIVTQPALLTNTVVAATFNGQNISCNGLSDGSIGLTVSGGTTAYTYAWSNSQTTQNISGLNANTYSVLVTDVNGCTTTNTITLTQPAVLTNTVVAATYNGQNISCNGLSNGSVGLTVAGGTTAYTYAWSNSQTTQNISGLNANTYSVLVTDVNGCTTTNTITLTQPAALTNTISVSSNYNGQNISCNGLSNGSINLNVLGGTTAYTYNWSNTQTTQNISGLNANAYSVLVTDVNGCTATNTITLTQPAVLTNTISISSSYNGQNISCNGLSDGSIGLTVAGGTTAYTYAWSNSQTTQNISGLNANTYSVLVTDVNGCTTTNTTTLTEPALLTNTLVAATYNGQNISCNGLSDGSIGLTVSGGTTAYTYAWSNSQTTQNISGLNANTYSVLITDVNGCTTTNTATLAEPALLTNTLVAITFNGQNISCNGLSDGSIGLTVAGGTTAYAYAWSNSQTTQNISGLNANTYSVIVTDVNGCSTTNTITLTQPTILTNTISISSNYSGQNISCNGASDGSINLTVSGGTTAYTYNWSNGATTQNVSALIAGMYSVTITDVNGCSKVDTLTLSQPLPIQLSSVIANVTCNSFTNGGINLSATGGTPGYLYNWSNASTTQHLTGIGAGSYTVVVTDTNGCSNSLVNLVIQDNPILLSSLSNNVKCNKFSNGSISTNITGGVTPFQYAWSNGSTTQNLSGLTAGLYFVLVTDSNNCSTTDTIQILEPDTVAASYILSGFPNGYNISLNGASDGSIDLSVIGGTNPYSYLWSTGATAQDLGNLTAGNYFVQILDSNGCAIVISLNLTEPYVLQLPNGLSPNGDGLNDYFVIHGLESYPDNELTVYNRWGNLVYSKSEYKNDWDGRSRNGDFLPEATYFVVLKINAPKEITLTGYVVVKQ